MNERSERTHPNGMRDATTQLPELTRPGLHEELLLSVIGLPGIALEAPVLDLGCGSGAWLARLAGKGFKNLRGVDRQPFVTFPAGIDVPFSCSYSDLDNDADLALGATRFGLITAIEVIEHLHNPGRLLWHASNYLADSGYFLLTTPNVHSVRARVRFAMTGKLAAFDPTNVSFEPTHVYPVFINCLDRLLPHYGLEAVERWTIPARRGSGSRPLMRMAGALLATVLPDQYPGDSLCVLIRRCARAATRSPGYNDR